MKKWRKRFQQWWMCHDEKPKDKDKRYIEKQNRQESRNDIKKELMDDNEFDYNWDCLDPWNHED